MPDATSGGAAAAGRPRVGVALALVLVVLAAAGFVLLRHPVLDAPCGSGGTPAPGGRWCPLYREDFQTPVGVGGFTNDPADDWYLAASNPYAGSLRSYPDRWATTGALSLNLASRSTEVVGAVDGAEGVLRLTGRTEVVDGRPQPLGGSFYPVIRPHAPVVRDQTSQLYGRYTVRFRTEGGYPAASPGTDPTATTAGRYGTAFLLWPADDRWADGEVDFPEMGWGDRVQGHVHTIGRPEVNAADVTTGTSSAVWSTATIEWSPGLLVLGLDGTEVFRTTTNVPSVPMRWGFQSGGMNAVPAPDVTGQLLVDRVEIQSYAAGPAR